MTERYINAKIRVLKAICQKMSESNGRSFYTITNLATQTNKDDFLKAIEELKNGCIKIKEFGRITVNSSDEKDCKFIIEIKEVGKSVASDYSDDKKGKGNEGIYVDFFVPNKKSLLTLLENCEKEYFKLQEPLINERSIELIATRIEKITTSFNLVKWLKKCGVEDELINSSIKERMVYDILEYLTYSSRKADQDILFKIIEESVHPLMYEGDEEMAEKVKGQFNGVLKYDGFILENSNLQKISEKEKSEKEKKKKSLEPVIKQGEETNKKNSHLISKNQNGDYLYDDKIIEMGSDTIYLKVFDILYSCQNQEGFVSYEKIEKKLVKSGLTPCREERERNKRIQNAINEGLFMYARVNGNKLENKTPNGNKLIVKKRGKGLKLNNQLL